MSIQVKELKEFLDELKDTDCISIDEGGLCLEVNASSSREPAYIEIGRWGTDKEEG